MSGYIGITCEREWIKWTVRVNGVYVCDFWRKSRAFELAHRLRLALDRSD